MSGTTTAATHATPDAPVRATSRARCTRDWDVEARDRDPIAVLEAQGALAGARAACRSATAAWPSRRSRSSAAAPRSWPWTSPTTPVTGLTRAGVRRRPRRQLREVRHARAQHRVRHQRLRRDAARSVGVGRQAAVRQPARRRRASTASRRASATASCSTAVRARTASDIDELATHAHARALVRPHRRSSDVIAHFPPRYRPAVQRDVAQGRSARTTSAPWRG